MIRTTSERYIFILPTESKQAHDFRAKLDELKYAYSMTKDTVSIAYQINVANMKTDVKELDTYLRERGMLNG